MNEEIENTLYREELTLASIKKRALASIVDEFLLSFLLIIALWDSFINAQTTEEIINLSNNFVMEYIFMKIVYQAFFTMQYGATIGKIVMKIKVVDLKTLSNPNVFSSLNRAIFRIVSETFFYLGFLWGMLEPAKRTWHDKTAKTLVVNA